MAIAGKTLGEIQFFELINQVSFFGQSHLQARNQITLVANSRCSQVPISTEFNAVKPFHGTEIFGDKLVIGKSIHIPFFGEKALTCINFRCQTFIVGIVYGRKKVLVIVAYANFKINCGFLRWVVFSQKCRHLGFYGRD